MSFSPRVFRPLSQNTTQVGTDADTLEKTFTTFTVPADTVFANGQKIRVNVFGTAAANANTKTVRIKLGATTLASISVGQGSSTAWHIECWIVRTGSAAQKATAPWNSGNSTSAYVSATENWATALALAVTGQNGTAAANDIVHEGTVIDWFAEAP